MRSHLIHALVFGHFHVIEIPEDVICGESRTRASYMYVYFNLWISMYIFFIFMQFSGKLMPNNRLAAPYPEVGSPLWEILDPPLVMI